MWWLWLIIGALAWQTVVVITFILSGEDEDITAMVGGGIVLITVWCIVKGVQWILRLYQSITYESFAVCSSKHAIPHEHIRIKKKDVDKYYQQGENEYFIKSCGWHPSNCINVNKIRKNGWFTQEWVDENVRKSKRD